MSTGIPVMIHLDPVTFKQLERIAAEKGIGMRRLIEAHVVRSLQPKPPPARTSRRSTTPPREGRSRSWVRLDAAQQVELRELLTLNWSIHELQQRFGCSRGTIENWRKRFEAEG